MRNMRSLCALLGGALLLSTPVHAARRQTPGVSPGFVTVNPNRGALGEPVPAALFGGVLRHTATFDDQTIFGIAGTLSFAAGVGLIAGAAWSWLAGPQASASVLSSQNITFNDMSGVRMLALPPIPW